VRTAVVAAREARGRLCAAAIFVNACRHVKSCPAMPAGSAFGPTRMKSLYITIEALHAEAVGDELLLRFLVMHEQSRRHRRSRPS
jgi:hypothetical protein